MSEDIVDSLRLLRESIARESGHVSEWSAHDLECSDTAYDAEKEIESLRRENEMLREALTTALACHVGTDEIWLDEARAALKGEAE